jgi:hypothetical protein
VCVVRRAVHRRVGEQAGLGRAVLGVEERRGGREEEGVEGEAEGEGYAEGGCLFTVNVS